MSKIVLKAKDLDGFFTAADKASLSRMDARFREAMASFDILSNAATDGERRKEEQRLIGLYNDTKGWGFGATRKLKRRHR